MNERLLLLFQVSSGNRAASYCSDDILLLVLPCPRRCCAVLIDVWSVMVLLLTSGDLEENMGPPIEQMLQTILDNQAKSDRRLNAMISVNILPSSCNHSIDLERNERVSVKAYERADDNSVSGYLEQSFNKFEIASQSESVEELWQRLKCIITAFVDRFVPSR